MTPIDKAWLLVTLIAGVCAITWFFITSDAKQLLPYWIIVGSLATLYLVAIPLRIVLNLIFWEQQQKRLLETVMCVIAFIALTALAMSVKCSFRSW